MRAYRLASCRFMRSTGSIEQSTSGLEQSGIRISPNSMSSLNGRRKRASTLNGLWQRQLLPKATLESRLKSLGGPQALLAEEQPQGGGSSKFGSFRRISQVAVGGVPRHAMATKTIGMLTEDKND